MKSKSEDTQPILGIRPCQCSKPGCRAVRIFIVYPQIDEDGVCYATLPPEYVETLAEALFEIAQKRKS